MKKVGILGLIAVLCACFCLAFGCGGNTDKPDDVTASIVGVKELKFKVGDATDENILKDVKVELSNGKTAKPTLDKKGATLDKAGRYDVVYAYNQTTVNGIVWVYGAPQLYYNGELLTADGITLTYAEAAESFDFTKGIAIKDSFDTELKVTAEGDKFNDDAGEYNVTYSAEDAVGNALRKQIKYTVTGGAAPVVDDYAYVISMDECVIPWDLKKNTRVTAYLDGDIINPENYEVTKEGLKLGTEYILSVGTGEKKMVVETENGNAQFTLTITDEGNPVFSLNVKPEYLYGGVQIAEPEKLIAEHDAYEFSYSVKDAFGNEYVTKADEGKLLFTDENGYVIKAGDYTLTATCAYGDKTASATRAFSVKNPVISAGEKMILTKETFTEPVDGVTEGYKFTKPDGSNAWEGRLYYDAPLGAYSVVSFDIYITGSSAEKDGKANVALSCCVDEDYRRITSVVEKKSGTKIAETDMLVNRWYTVTFYAYSQKSGALYVYFNPAEPVGCEGFITGDKFVAINGLTESAFGLMPSASATLTFNEEGGEIVATYTGNSSPWNSRAEITRKMLDKLTAERKLGNRVLALDFKYEGKVDTLQFWYYTLDGNGAVAAKDVTLEALVGNKVATIACDGYNKVWAAVEQGEWYTLYVDVDKFATTYGELVFDAVNNNCGLQAATQTTLKYKGVKFISRSDVPELLDPLFAFEVLVGCTVTTDYKTGITTYVPTGNGEYGSRAQFTEAMYNETTKYFAMQEDYSVKMEFRFVDSVERIQFWYYTAAAAKDVTLEALVNVGTAVIVKDGFSYNCSQLVKGEWYTVYVDIHKFGEIAISNNDRGVQAASFSSVEYKFPEFVKNSEIPAAEKVIDAFEVLCGCTVTTDYKTGITTYVPTGSGEYGSRAQFTEAMYNETTKYFAMQEDYSVKMEFRFVDSVERIQFWYYTAAAAKDVTLEALVNVGTAVIVKDGFSYNCSQLVKGEWYTVYVDIHKFGEIAISNNDRGVQAASFSSVEYKFPEFVKNSEIPAAEKVIDAFEKLEGATNITIDYKTGISTYTTTADNDWSSRVQFTEAMYNETTKYFAMQEDYSVKMEFRFVGDVKNVQFWYIPPEGGMKDVTLTALVNSGTAVIVKDGVSYSFDQLVKGEWYTVYVDIHKFGEIAISNNDRGVQVASVTTIEYKFPEFVKNSEIPATEVL